MTSEQFRDKQYEISVMAGINQRYHQSRAGHFAWRDRGFRISIGMLSAVAASLALITVKSTHPAWNWVSMIIATLVAIIGTILNVFPFGDWERQHADLFRRWSDVREDVDGLLYDLDEEPSSYLVERLKNLEAKVHRICGIEPSCKKKLLEMCQKDEHRSRCGESPACAT